MKTRTIGEILRAERIHHRLSLLELSQRTRIRLEYLQALEENRFTDLPAATFVKGYIKTYSQLFGFDYQPLVALLRRDYKESAKGKLVPRDFLKPVLRRKLVWTPVTAAVAGLGVLFSVVFAYIAVQWYQLSRPPAITIFSPQENALVSSQVIVEGQTDTEASVLVNAQPISLQSDGTFRTEVFIPRQGLSTITIEATDRQGKTQLEQRTVYVSF